jgi:hypothetical protein
MPSSQQWRSLFGENESHERGTPQTNRAMTCIPPSVRLCSTLTSNRPLSTLEPSIALRPDFSCCIPRNLCLFNCLRHLTAPGGRKLRGRRGDGFSQIGSGFAQRSHDAYGDGAYDHRQVGRSGHRRGHAQSGRSPVDRLPDRGPQRHREAPGGARRRTHRASRHPRCRAPRCISDRRVFWPNCAGAALAAMLFVVAFIVAAARIAPAGHFGLWLGERLSHRRGHR